MTAASDFEFKHRFWMIGGIFFLAFAAYNLDHQNAGAAIVEWLARARGTTANNLDYHLIFALAALVAMLAAQVRTWGTAYIKAEVMVGQHLHTTQLVADGPYRYVRNPLYLGNILLALGFGLMASRIGFFILVVGMWAFVYRLILREEAGILSQPGRQLSRLLRGGAATAAVLAAQGSSSRRRAELGRWFARRSLYVGDGWVHPGLRNYFEPNRLF